MIVVEETSDRMVVKSPAKVNLFFEVLGQRPDGFHEIVTVIQEVSLFDTLTLELRVDPGIRLVCNDPLLNSGKENLVHRAARVFLERLGGSRGVTIHLDKGIPAGAGLGGGSGDAATAMVVLDRLLQSGLGAEELRRASATVGSDCPFFVSGGTALCRGRGEIVEPLAFFPRYHFLLVRPRFEVSTGAVYRHVALRLRNRDKPVTVPLDDLRSGDLERARAAIFNRLEEAALELVPDLQEVREALDRCGLKHFRLTGSGSAFFGLFNAVAEAQATAAMIRQHFPDLPADLIPVEGGGAVPAGAKKV
ncbi:MAG TPA: 4-(cytidine 5'-diphospho)-2-C-methyl-D-erythritol kinase [Planctomycetota bacterium]|jgi:4-diphosphocytidyl-2-C-methyl-D-erythritol kinase|nr:4-(cytidine 5'-diphospho)-2-C-methyl-D-erythritol kinase [Planctomycetota bacterium]